MIKLKKVTISLLMAVGLLGATPLTASAASVYLSLIHICIGIGLERLTMQLIGEDNVREATLFPRDLSRLEPVSYTHLDVYKRQPIT